MPRRQKDTLGLVHSQHTPGNVPPHFLPDKNPDAKAQGFAIPKFSPLPLRFWPHAELRAGLGLAGALDFPGFRAVDVMRRNPVGVVSSRGGNGSAGAVLDTLGFGALSAAGGSLLTGLATLALLREVGGNPNGIKEVDHTNEASQEEEVEEDAISSQPIACDSSELRNGIHLGVKDAGLGLNHAHSAIEGVNGEKLALVVSQNGGQVQTKILRVHLGGEAIADALLLSSGDLDGIARGGQVTDHLALLSEVPQAASKEVHRDGIGLVVCECDQSLSRVTVDKLDAEDLRSRERRLRLDIEAGCLSLGDLLGVLQVFKAQSVN